MKKRGFSHIEIILGFVMFVGALLFAFFYLKLSYGNMNKHSEADYSQVENAMKELVYEYSVRINDSKINKNQDIVYVTVNVTGNSSVFNYTGFKSASYLSESDMRLYFNRTMTGYRYDLRISKGIDNSAVLSAQLINPDYYTISPQLARNIISEKKMLTLNTSYYKDYEALKKSIGIKNDFGIYAKVGEKEIIMTRQKDKVVYAESKNRELLKSDGQVVFGNVRIEIW